MSIAFRGPVSTQDYGYGQIVVTIEQYFRSDFGWITPPLEFKGLAGRVH